VVQLPAEPVIKPRRIWQPPRPAPPSPRRRERLARFHCGSFSGGFGACSRGVSEKGVPPKVNPLNLFSSSDPGCRYAIGSADQFTTGGHQHRKNRARAFFSALRLQTSRQTGSRQSHRSRARVCAGLQAHQAHRLSEAIRPTARRRSWTRRSSTLTTTSGSLRLNGNLPLALSAYEGALAVTPDSLDARYNFGLALKQGNYVLDSGCGIGASPASVSQTKAAPTLCSVMFIRSNLGDRAKARQHYLKVLETDPRNPQAGTIRYWLTEKPR